MGKLIQFRREHGPDASSDHELALACANGDAAAQSLVFQRHAPAIHRFIARMCSSRRADVEDLLQLAFLAAFKNIGSFHGAKLSSWLFGVAANTVRSHVRKEGSRRRMHDALAETIDASTQGPDADLPRLREAIAALPVELREVIVLVDLEGERGSDVARMLDVAESTMWARLAKARAQLRTALGGAP